jgi:vacuolar iron transporter family protein
MNGDIVPNVEPMVDPSNTHCDPPTTKATAPDLENGTRSGDGNAETLEAKGEDKSTHSTADVENQGSKSCTGSLRSLGLEPCTISHLGNNRQYWRDIMLGVNDGLVSTFLLVAGVVGGGLSSPAILLTAIAGGVAGAVSMCSGEYIATKSQNQVLHGEIALERKHVTQNLEDELSEVASLLELIGIPQAECDLHGPIIDHYRHNPDALLKIMIALEFGVLEQEERSPMLAGLISCGVFILGSLPSIIPFIFSGDKPFLGFIAAAVATTVSLLTVGGIKSWASRGNCLTSALENLLVAGLGGAFAYGIGILVAMVSGA